MKKPALLLVLIITIFSCMPRITSIPLDNNKYTKPEIGTENTKEIGESLIIKGDQQTKEAYVITKCPKFRITLIDYDQKEGNVLPLAGENKDWLLYYRPQDVHSGSSIYTIGVAKRKKDPSVVLPFINSVNGFSPRDIEGFEAVPGTYNDDNCARCFKKEFVYNGKVGNSLKFMYREYVNDMAIPAFTQDLQYDLSEGDIIGFKGMRLQVKQATNTKITYKILNDFSI